MYFGYLLGLLEAGTRVWGLGVFACLTRRWFRVGDAFSRSRYRWGRTRGICFLTRGVLVELWGWLGVLIGYTRINSGLCFK